MCFYVDHSQTSSKRENQGRPHEETVLDYRSSLLDHNSSLSDSTVGLMSVAIPRTRKETNENQTKKYIGTPNIHIHPHKEQEDRGARFIELIQAEVLWLGVPVCLPSDKEGALNPTAKTVSISRKNQKAKLILQYVYSSMHLEC